MLHLPTATVDLDGLRLFRDGEEHRLTPQEAQLLRVLADHDGATVSRETLLQDAMGISPKVVTRALDAAISRLRAKLEPNSRRPQSLMSVRGKGYRLQLSDPPALAATTPEPDDRVLGREPARAEAHQLLDAQGVVLLQGPGGVGKTTLADRLLRDRWGSDAAPDRRRLELADARTVDELLTALGVGLGLGEHPSEDRLQVALDDAESLWVFDNLEQLDDEGTALLQRLVEATNALKVLTSRRPLWEGLPTVVLGGLDEASAMALLARAARRISPSVAPAEEALRSLARGVDGLPLALELLGAQLPRMGAEVLLRTVDGALADGFQLEDGRGGRHRNLGVVLAASWETLSPPVQRTMAWWSAYGGPFDLDDAEALRPPDAPPALVALDDLSRASLVVLREGIVHPWATVRAFAAEQLDETDRVARDQALVRALVERCPTEGWSEEASLAAWRPWVLARRRDLLDAVERADAPEVRARLALTLLMAGSQLGRPARERLGRAARAAAVEADHARWQVEALVARLRHGNWPHGAQQALDLFDEIEPFVLHVPMRLQLRARYTQALALRRAGQMEQAEAILEDGVRRCEAEDIQSLGALMRQELGAICRRTGRIVEAAAHLLRALAQHRSLGEPRSEAGCHVSLASIRRQQGRLDEAQEHAERAVGIARAHDQPLVLANALNNLANLRADRNVAGAKEAIDESIALSRSLGDRPGLAVALGGRGMLHDAAGDLLDAEIDYQEARSHSRGVGLLGAEAFWTYRLGDLAHRRGLLELADRRYVAAIEQLDAVNRTPARLHARAVHGMLLAEQGRHDEANARLAEAAPLARGEADDRLILATGRAAVARWQGASKPDTAFDELRVARAALHRPLLFVARALLERAPAADA